MKNDCGCSGNTLIFACCGGADAGEITDKAARELTRKGIGKMSCLAGIGGNISGIVMSTKGAGRVLVIDGCPLYCAKKTMERAGINPFMHICLSDLGLKKGESPLNEHNLQKVLDKAEEMLRCV